MCGVWCVMCVEQCVLCVCAVSGPAKSPSPCPTAAKEEDRREADEPQEFLLDPADEGTLGVWHLASKSGRAGSFTGFKASNVLRKDLVIYEVLPKGERGHQVHAKPQSQFDEAFPPGVRESSAPGGATRKVDPTLEELV